MAIVELLLRTLAASVVRLFGLSEERIDDLGTLVLLAGASATQSPGAGCLRVELVPAATISPIFCLLKERRGNGSVCDELSASLVQRAVATREPAVFPAHAQPSTGSSDRSPPPHQPQPQCPSQQKERCDSGVLGSSDLVLVDCAEDYATHGSIAFSALPLCVGSKLLGVLWISAGGRCSAAARHLLTNPTGLQQLALSVSAALSASAAGPDEVPYICWVSAVLARLSAAATLHSLVYELTGAVEQHVRRRYLLELQVQAVLAPAAGSDLAYLLCTEPPAAGAAGPLIMGTSSSKCLQRQRISSCADLAAQASSAADALTPPAGGGAASASAANPKGRTTCFRSIPVRSESHEMLNRHHSARGLHTLVNRHSHGLAQATLAEVGAGEAQARAGSGLRPASRSASCSHHQPPQLPPQHSLVEHQPGALSQPRPATSSATTAAATAGVAAVTTATAAAATSAWPRTCSRSAERGPTMLAAALMATGSTTQSNVPAECASQHQVHIPNLLANGYSSVAPSALRAKAFKLSHTLFQRWIEMSSGGSCASSAGVSGASVVSGAPAAAAAVGLPGLVITSCGRWVQDVRQPSRDVCLMMAMAGAAGRSPPLSGGPAGAGLGGPGAPGAFGESPAVSAGSHAVQSLVLLGMGPACTAGGHLGLYLMFPSQLPLQLLEALRDSCGALLRSMLGPLVQNKLRHELAAEVDTVRAGVPGNYAVLPSTLVNTNYSMAGPSGVGRDEHLSANYNTISSTMALAGEVLPPGRLARTVTMTQVEPGDAAGVNSTMFFSGHCAFTITERGSHQNTVDANISCQAGQGADAGAAAAPDLVNDLDFTVDFAAFTGLNNPPASGRAPRRAMTLGGMTSPRVVQIADIQQPNVSPLSRGGSVTAQGMLYSGSILATGGLLRNTMVSRPSRGPAAVIAAATASVGGSGTPTMAHASAALSRAINPSVLSHETLRARFDGGIPEAVPVAAVHASVLTVQEADSACCMRAHMGLLVESLLGTMRSTVAATASPDASHATAPFTGGSGTTRATRFSSTPFNAEDLDELQLYDILGEGASGVVLQGMMGTVPVACKLIEIPQLDMEGSSSEAMGTLAGTSTGAGGLLQVGADPAAAAARQQQAQKDHLNARRTMYRNAMELAVLRSTSHVNIVQCLGVFDNVVLEHTTSPGGVRSCVLRRYKGTGMESAEPGASPICTAIVTELCDNSLATILSDKSFPRVVPVGGTAPPRTPPTAGGGSGGGSGASGKGGDAAKTVYKLEMRGVYLTVLEIALALRHLHARRLVHRDLKPANVLLKSSQGDPRGWTTKLADFGFTLLLDRQDWSYDSTGNRALLAALAGTVPSAPTGYNNSGGVANMPGNSANSSASSQALTVSGGSGCFYTIQEQACGTVTHMAPEAMRQNARIDASVDMFGLGILMWDIAAGRGYRPYKNLKPDDIPSAVMGGLRPVFPDWVPTAYRKLAQACWAAEPHRRPTAADVVLTVKAQLALLAAPQQQPSSLGSGGSGSRALAASAAAPSGRAGGSGGSARC